MFNANWGVAMKTWQQLFVAFSAFLPSFGGISAPAPDDSWPPEIHAPLTGPYIIDAEVLAELDRGAPDCASAGPLNFQCLVFHDRRAGMTRADLPSNPFLLPVFDQIAKTVSEDLDSIRNKPEYGGADALQLRKGFLTYQHATIELVGVVNRMDRQFNRDIVPEHHRPLACGEISAVYRFGYEGDLPGGASGERHYKSRLPVTMNVIFPAEPWSRETTCREVAARWLEYVRLVDLGASREQLLAQARRIVSSLRPADIDRIELNMQGSRAPASADDANDFGTLATYIIRVFRWNPQKGAWWPSYLTNQIDRARLLGNSAGDDNTCAENRGVPIARDALKRFLLSMGDGANGANAVGDIDNGLLNIPLPFLACRAVSISPGSASRSGNQPFWDAASGVEQIISNAEIEAALRRYRQRYPDSLSFVRSPDDFRTRLNEQSCSGCHQTRAIAGFHLAGADRPGTSPVNSVYLPGSPHFFGDQLRRLGIVQGIAAGRTVTGHDLAASYAGRPLNRFTALKPNPDGGGVQLVGGWGGTCLSAEAQPASQRKWGCAASFVCKPVFQSRNQPGVGMCVNPAGAEQIGESMQQGVVTSDRFGIDHYARVSPPIVPSAPGDPRDTTIPYSRPAPAGNSYFSAHQEYYKGKGGSDRMSGESDEDYARRVRDQSTGGFPAGALRLSECVGLPGEATCGVLASSGFNKCLDEVREGKRTPDNCFGIYTSYAGARACDASNPCRDDYICTSPMGYTAANARAKWQARKDRREAARNSSEEDPDNRRVLGLSYFGETMPDDAWLHRNVGQGDRRGICVPPYFVFQFKADGHQVPATMQSRR
jgi:hypothetical protein